MHDSMLNKLDQLKNRIAEIETLLVDSETVKDIEKYTQLNKEFSELKPIVAKFDESKKTGNKVPVSVTASTVVLVSLILEKFVVTTEGSAVVDSLGDEVALVE